MLNNDLIKRVDEFLKERGKAELLLNNPLFMSFGGSHASNMATLQSDIDIRILTLSSEDDLLGIQSFEHKKLVGGDRGINFQDDLDIEIFSTRRFLKDLFHGEIVSWEMVFSPKDAIIKNSEAFNEIKQNKDLFYSKAFVLKNLGFYKKNYHTSLIDGSKAKSSLRKERIEKYGYDTKAASNALKSLDVCEDFLDLGEFTMVRANREFLIDVRNGLLSKEDYKDLVESRYQAVLDKVDKSKLSKYPESNKVNKFMIEFHKKYSL